ncbi:ParB/Srx family N-terminal domain-containing protein [Sphingobium chungangianum]
MVEPIDPLERCIPMNDNADIRGDGLIRSLKVELRPLAAVRPAKRNARTHSEKQIEQIASSIRQFGLTTPIIVNDEGMIVAGHGRHAAAKLLGMADVPVIPIHDLDPAELRTYALADNRIAQNAGWDAEVLRIEFEELNALELSFDLEITGFSTTEMDQLLVITPEEEKLEKLPEATVSRSQRIAQEKALKSWVGEADGREPFREGSVAGPRLPTASKIAIVRCSILRTGGSG